MKTGVIVELENIPRGWGRVVIQWDDGHFWSNEHSRGYDVHWKGPMIASRIR